MSNNRPNDGNNRHRNLSVTSNMSSSSYKEQSSNMNHSRPLENGDQRRGTTRLTSTNFQNGMGRDGAQRHQNSSSGRDIQQRPASLFDSATALNHQPEGDQQEVKRQYENIMAQIQQLHPTFIDETQPAFMRQEVVTTPNNESVYINRAAKLQEAQQRLIQLQELMQHVSIDLDCNPYSHVADNKNRKPREFPMDFLRNVPSGTRSAARVNPHSTPRQSNRSSQQLPQFPSVPQNNLSQEIINPKRTYSSSHHVNGSLMDVFTRSEPSFDSSDPEENDPIGIEEDAQDVQSSHDPILPNENPNSSFRAPLDHLARIEHQLDRTNSLVEMVLIEQRRQALVTESLLSAISNLQQSRPCRTSPGFSLSGLPINSSWNNDPGSSQHQADFHVLAQAVNQCCHMLTQLQRDLAGVQQSLMETNPPESATAAAAPPPTSESQLNSNPFRATRGSSGSSYECNMDRFDPQVTLNNRVPPGTRTNNYWDNFRSYSRQNLLSSGPSNVTSSDNGISDAHLLHPASGLQAAARPASAETDSRSRDPHHPTRRTKRKVNKGQRQMEIGVHCPPPHADNRALAYGLLSVRRDASSTSNPSTPAVLEVNPIGRNLNRQIPAEMSTSSTSAPEASGGSKIAKDTTLKYSGARPKENRRLAEVNAAAVASAAAPPPAPQSSSSSNVNLLAERESQEKGQGLESLIRIALKEHAARPHFLTQLLDLLHKFDSDPLRQMALNALEDCVTDNHPFELGKVFSSIVGQHRELTPQLLESFLVAIQQFPTEEADHDEIEGATGGTQDENLVFLIRHALTPFLFRRMSEIQPEILSTLAKLESQRILLQNREVTNGAASTSGREDDLAEADQSCDQSCDGMMDPATAPASGMEEEESGGGQHHLDEVPTRLMAILAPSMWSSGSPTVPDDSSSRNNNNNNNRQQQQRSSNEPESITDWFPEDSGV